MSFMPDNITSRTFLSFLPLFMLSEQGCRQHCYSGEIPHLASRHFLSIVLSTNTCSPVKHIWQHYLHHRCCFIEVHGPCYHITGFPYQSVVLGNESFPLLSTAEDLGGSHIKWPNQRKKLSIPTTQFLLPGS